MKIAMLGHKRIPSREGGVEVVVEELSTRLVKKGNQVDVYNRKGKNVQDKNADKGKTKIKEYKGVNIITIPTINKKGVDALIYSFLATIRAIFGKYDVLHYHAEGSCAMLWIPHLFKKKIVVTIHGLDWQRAKWGGFATKYIKFGEKMAVKYADKIIVLSKGVQKYFKETYNKETYFIPNGVNKPVERKADIIKEKYNLNKDDYILFLARIVPEKGLHYLLDAFKQIDTNKKLVIVGGASHTNDYLQEIKKKANEDDRVIMTGFVQGQELEELFSNCYLYCLPSDIEGMPISLLEAMSYGNRCLVSNIEENLQVVEKYAWSFKKGNIEDLKQKLEQIIKDKNKIPKEEIQNYILKKYNWNDVVNKTEKLYIKQEKHNEKNVILADCQEDELKTLKQGIEEIVKQEFKVCNKVCNGKRNIIYNIYRYLCYIFYPLKFFLQRKKFSYIICWQQFYALFFAFYCRLFKVKKQNVLVVCNFTYKEKQGFVGNVYNKVMKYCVNNKYIDYIHIPSSNYAKKMSKEFNIPIEKFIVLPFGLDDTYEKYKDSKSEYKNYSLAIGRSNRDYDFLINVWKLMPSNEKLLIICDQYKNTENLPKNIILRKDIVGELQYPYIINAKTMIIPLKDENICSGDTVLLTAMSYYKPIIITEPSTLAEMYIENKKNGFCLKKDEKLFAREMKKILADEKKLNQVAENARKCFEDKYSRYTMGKKIGKIIKNKVNK